MRLNMPLEEHQFDSSSMRSTIDSLGQPRAVSKGHVIRPVAVSSAPDLYLAVTRVLCGSIRTLSPSLRSFFGRGGLARGRFRAEPNSIGSIRSRRYDVRPAVSIEVGEGQAVHGALTVIPGDLVERTNRSSVPSPSKSAATMDVVDSVGSASHAGKWPLPSLRQK